MNAIAFAYGIGSEGPEGYDVEEYKLLISSNVEEVFHYARRFMPVRAGFDQRLTAGLVSPEKYYHKVTTDAIEPGVCLEILLGDAASIELYLKVKQENEND